MIRVTQKATATSWISVAEIESRLKDTDSTSEELGALAVLAASGLDQILGRPAALQGYEVHSVGDDIHNKTLYLPRFPVDPTSITVAIRGEVVTDWTCADPSEGRLFRSAGWPTGDEYDAAGVPLISVSMGRAGFVVPDQSKGAWGASTAYAVGDWLRPLDPSVSPLLFLCTVAGTSSASTEPTWPSTPGEEVAGNGALRWKGYEVEELPDVLRAAAYLTVREWDEDRPEGLMSFRSGAFSEQYARVAESAVPMIAREVVAGYRR